MCQFQPASQFHVWLALLGCFYFSHVFCNLRKLLERKEPAKFKISDCIFVFWKRLLKFISFPRNVFLLLVFVLKVLLNLFSHTDIYNISFKACPIWADFRVSLLTGKNWFGQKLPADSCGSQAGRWFLCRNLGTVLNLNKEHKLSLIPYRTW